MEMRTGLSRRSGGRCVGSKVCCFLTSPGTARRSAMPGSETLTVTLPSTVENENSLLGAALGGGAVDFIVASPLPGFTTGDMLLSCRS